GWLTDWQLGHLLEGEWQPLGVGPFQILDRLGAGGISEVFRAWDTLNGRFAALKVLRPELASRPEAVREFRHEAACTAQLAHPNVVKVFDAGQDGSRHYFSMELIDGMDLERFAATVGPLPVEHACDYARQAAQGLQHAHGFGLVHRDIKPANLYLAHPPLGEAPQLPHGRKPPDPTVKIIDWGLARSAATVEQPGQGPLVGTADYMAPEQIQDSSLADIRADIYSLGCTLYFLLAGEPVFPGTSVMQKIVQHQEAPPPSLKHLRPDVPDELDGLVQRMLAKRPEDRPPIPLLVVAPLRKLAYAYAGIAAKPGSGQGAMRRPGSAPVLLRPAAAKATSLNLPRPTTQTALPRPGAK
ncbi:MAG: serine/threonine protein kinase, partial [Gemmataceae bacterium]|nr:serine/threonine protein kinase [Gemmataceae bacterium]